MTNSKRKCAYCGERFDSMACEAITTPVMFFCCIDHQFKYALEAKNKLSKKRKWSKPTVKRKTKAEVEATRTKKEWSDLAQKAFNAYIRHRDKELPCISCGTRNDIQMHAGHYKSVGAHRELRFNEKNCHKQCVRCNNFLSGNIEGYREGLINRYGESIVIYLNKHHQSKKYTVDDYREIIKEYKARIK